MFFPGIGTEVVIGLSRGGQVPALNIATCMQAPGINRRGGVKKKTGLASEFSLQDLSALEARVASIC